MCHAFKIFICSKCNLKLWYYKSIVGGEVTFTHHVSPVQRCGGQRPRLVFVSAPKMQLCTPSHDTQVWCGLPGSGNCCGRVSLTSTGLKGRPESTPPPQKGGKKREEKSVNYLKTTILQTYILSNKRCLNRDKMHGSHSLRIHMATVSSRVLNSQCKLFLEEGWHSEGSGVLSLHVQTKKNKNISHAWHAG